MYYRYFLVFTSLCLLVPGALYAKPNLCPEARYLPQFTINVNTKSDLALYDSWQIFYDGTPISDIQLTDFAKHDSAKEKASKDLNSRGQNVFFGMLSGALGTAISSMGWVLYGQDQVSSTLSLSMALSGIVLSLAGTIFVSESIQVPLEPYLAPTPRHRITREEARNLVFRANKGLNDRICNAAKIKE